MLNLDKLLKKYYPYSIFLAGMFVFITTTLVCTYITKESFQITFTSALKNSFINIRALYLIAGATFLTILNLKNKYKKNEIEYSEKTCVLLAIINAILFIFTATLIFIGANEVLYKVLELIILVFVGTFSQSLIKGYKGIINIIRQKK